MVRSSIQCVCSTGDIWTMYLLDLPYLSNKRFLNECDAALISSSHLYEDASMAQLKSWLKSLPQNPPVYAIGPLLPPGYGRHSMESSESEKNQVERDVEGFLTEMQSKYGEKSVIFVGFCLCHLTNTLDLHAPFFSDLFWNQLLAYSTRVHWWSHTGTSRNRNTLCTILSSIYISLSGFIPDVFFNSDTVPRISLRQSPRGNCQEYKRFRAWISYTLGATAIHLEPPGMESKFAPWSIQADIITPSWLGNGMVPHALRKWECDWVTWKWGTNVSLAIAQFPVPRPYDWAHSLTGFAGPFLPTNQVSPLTWVGISRSPSNFSRFEQVPMDWSPCSGMELRRKGHVKPLARSFGRCLMRVMANWVRSWGEMWKKWNGNIRKLGTMTERQREGWTLS